ncbi:hypothetical protein T484DRAFT_1798241, partial [Baffinella frigidus]
MISAKSAKAPARPAPIAKALGAMIAKHLPSVPAFLVAADIHELSCVSARHLRRGVRVCGFDRETQGEAELLDFDWMLRFELGEPGYDPEAVDIVHLARAVAPPDSFARLEDLQAAIEKEVAHQMRESRKLVTKPSVPLPTGPAHPNAENLKAVLKERFETIAEAFAFFDRNGSWMLTKHHVMYAIERLRVAPAGAYGGPPLSADATAHEILEPFSKVAASEDALEGGRQSEVGEGGEMELALDPQGYPGGHILDMADGVEDGVEMGVGGGEMSKT